MTLYNIFIYNIVMIILYIILLVLLLLFFYRFPLNITENLEVKDIAATKTDKKTNEGSCDQDKSLSNLVSQYNILDSEIKKNTQKITLNTTDISKVKTLAAQNQAGVTKINGLIKQLEAAATEKK